MSEQVSVVGCDVLGMWTVLRDFGMGRSGVDESAVEVFVAGVSRVASTECDRFNFFCNNENDTPSFNEKIA